MRAVEDGNELSSAVHMKEKRQEEQHWDVWRKTEEAWCADLGWRDDLARS